MALICPKCGSAERLPRSRGGTECKQCRHDQRISARRKVRREALEAYGGRCTCCGETEPSFLCFDHIDGNGNVHRRQNRISGVRSMARWLKQNGWPSGFQILCANCNLGKHLNGACPHTVEGQWP